MKQILKAAVLAGAVSALASTQSFAQETYPSRPITLIHGSLPGGSTDMIARSIAAGMSERLGQSVVVEVRPGSGGVVMLGALARSKPDGYTIGVPISAVLTQGPHIQKDLPYDTFRDFTPITKIGDQAVMIVTTPGFPAKTFAELITIAKSKPVSIVIYAPVNKVILAAIESATGAKFLQVPFSGPAQGMPALYGGHVQAAFDSPNTSLGPVKEGKLRALIMTTAKRSTMQPDVPTVSETLIPGFDYGIWYGMFAPAGTPADRVERVYREAAAVMNTPKVRDFMANAAVEVSGMPPAQLATLLKAEYERDGAIIRKYDIK